MELKQNNMKHHILTEEQLIAYGEWYAKSKSCSHDSGYEEWLERNPCPLPTPIIDMSALIYATLKERNLRNVHDDMRNAQTIANSIITGKPNNTDF